MSDRPLTPVEWSVITMQALREGRAASDAMRARQREAERQRKAEADEFDRLIEEADRTLAARALAGRSR